MNIVPKKPITLLIAILASWMAVSAQTGKQTPVQTQPANTDKFDDAHKGNGCLGGLPGEYRKGLKKLFRRQADGHMATETLDAAIDWDMAGPGTVDGPDGSICKHENISNRIDMRGRDGSGRRTG